MPPSWPYMENLRAVERECRRHRMMKVHYMVRPSNLSQMLCACLEIASAVRPRFPRLNWMCKLNIQPNWKEIQRFHDSWHGKAGKTCRLLRMECGASVWAANFRFHPILREHELQLLERQDWTTLWIEETATLTEDVVKKRIQVLLRLLKYGI
ncbi:unnamed protein product [Periconia digitata]|uniref:Uncharacterized protein n=1 Tax=Periconia digitata TaxID=1303443 RepID=A0A9W4UB58_9PLEO|nr:unnamed protein product [Periconia digitata]